MVLAANSFDLWQKDAFFSAAEEVQSSADTMESTFRTWVRERRKGGKSQELDELFRELQTALGTAKWQLEEFEKAIRLSYRIHADDITTTLHRQFVTAIGSQISHIETALRESFSEEHEQPLQWVTLDDNDRDDLAAFLSGVPGISQSMKDEFAKLGSPEKRSIPEELATKIDIDLNFETVSRRGTCDKTDVLEDVDYTDMDDNIIDLEAKEIPQPWDGSICQADRTISETRTWILPDNGALNIVIADKDEQKKLLMSSNKAPHIESRFNAIFCKRGSTFYLQARARMSNYTKLRVINWINQAFSWIARSHRQLKNFNCSVQFKLALMIMIFLIVPFLL